MNTLSNFSEFALSRGEMKKVTGGITCTCDYGGGVFISGPCSGPSIKACNGYACSGGATNTGKCRK